MRYGYFLSCEEYEPASLVRQAKMAEEAGFDALWISDHYHPWLDEQGQSGFVWSIIGAISQVTSLPVTTAVTCPTTRIHPAVIAQAAATASLLTGGKFTLGVGTGEALNEHITGAPWPPAAQRQEMLEEAVTIIAELFTGEQLTHRGKYYEVDTARLYSVPAVAAAHLRVRVRREFRPAGRPDRRRVHVCRPAGGPGQGIPRPGRRQPPVQGGLKGCWAPDAAEARQTMLRLWPNDSIPGEATQLLPLPRHFEQVSQLVTEDLLEAPCGPDPQPYLDAIRAYEHAGFDEVYLQQVGGRLDGTFEFFATQVMPRLREG